ncbi:hypothetical protein JMJ77_0002241 [Colletotrichum scovillei]|uniref:Uncharacterized protein n=1 Tax=Colletotrichum scovillei TaxID=1209932 RepID=A0A9P7R988_9PEZI|nr:hypothetical protein JMJ77_0002241 [Colletotrichum scovillei]KAG7070659.1 hypothetical protein JMJ76_0001906 [Colletotrichum scovillei]KAG7078874.1 hypothetical protein JMJ78_0002537 [Colletotrichum scovillei]
MRATDGGWRRGGEGIWDGLVELGGISGRGCECSAGHDGRLRRRPEMVGQGNRADLTEPTLPSKWQKAQLDAKPGGLMRWAFGAFGERGTRFLKKLLLR